MESPPPPSTLRSDDLAAGHARTRRSRWRSNSSGGSRPATRASAPCRGRPTATCRSEVGRGDVYRHPQRRGRARGAVSRPTRWPARATRHRPAAVTAWVRAGTTSTSTRRLATLSSGRRGCSARSSRRRPVFRLSSQDTVAAALLSVVGGTLSGDAVLKGRSLFANRLGEVVAAPDAHAGRRSDRRPRLWRGAVRRRRAGLAAQRADRGRRAAGVPVRRVLGAAGRRVVDGVGGPRRLQGRAGSRLPCAGGRSPAR